MLVPFFYVIICCNWMKLWFRFLYFLAHSIIPVTAPCHQQAHVTPGFPSPPGNHAPCETATLEILFIYECSVQPKACSSQFFCCHTSVPLPLLSSLRHLAFWSSQSCWTQSKWSLANSSTCQPAKDRGNIVHKQINRPKYNCCCGLHDRELAVFV